MPVGTCYRLYSLDSTKELVNTLSSNIGIPILNLIDKKIGGKVILIEKSKKDEA